MAHEKSSKREDCTERNRSLEYHLKSIQLIGLVKKIKKCISGQSWQGKILEVKLSMQVKRKYGNHK